MERPRFVPASTYRLQIHAGFTLAAARTIVPYLQRLGVGAIYTSPYFASEPGSTHGYDITNHNLINAEAGGLEAHTAFTDATMNAGLQHIVDFVPNHMGISTATNPWWRDVLANGPDSPSARFFDIDWDPFKTELRRKLLLPILGDQDRQVLDRGELQLDLVDSQLVLKYFDHRLPINAHDVPDLQGLAEAAPETATRVIAAFNGTPGDVRSFDRLHELLEAQAYRLAYWRTAAHEINYRRFFDVNTLAGLRVEDPHVFEAIHRLLATLLREGRVTGVRIDHPDGLFDPASYFDRLQDLAAEAWGVGRRPGTRILYVLAEKILSGRERLPSGWPVHGTTGYNFINQLNGLFVQPGHARRMRRAYAKLTGQTQSFDDLLYETKRLIMDTAMASELTVLAHMLDRIGETNRKSRDFTLNSIRDMLVEVVACFPIYRSYVDEHGWAPEDRAALERAISRARRRNPAMESSIFDFFREVMLPRDPSDVPAGPERRGGYPPADADEAAARLKFAMKFQQYTGPLPGQGARGYGVLSPQRPALAERGGRRSVTLRRGGAGVPRDEPPAATGMAVRDDRDRDARYQTRRGRARAHQRAVGDAGRMGARGRQVDARQQERPHDCRRRAGSRPQRRIPLLPGAAGSVAFGRSAAGRPRAAAPGLYGQSRQGSEAAFELGQSRRAIRERPHGLR